MKGVRPGENPELTVMWTILGYPPCGVAVPLFVAAGADQPDYVLKSADSDNCRLCDEALVRRTQVFPLKRGNGKNYFNFRKAMEFIGLLSGSEENNFQLAGKMLQEQYEKGRMDKQAILSLYRELKTEEQDKR